jgi:hypothetical protein
MWWNGQSSWDQKIRYSDVWCEGMMDPWSWNAGQELCHIHKKTFSMGRKEFFNKLRANPMSLSSVCMRVVKCCS